MSTGFCRVCSEEHVVELYARQDRREAKAREAAWRTRTQRPELRQGIGAASTARHRLLVELRPREPAESFDPLELGYEALHALKRVQSTLPGARNALADLERVKELVRRLAWGPDE